MRLIRSLLLFIAVAALAAMPVHAAMTTPLHSMSSAVEVAADPSHAGHAVMAHDCDMVQDDTGDDPSHMSGACCTAGCSMVALPLALIGVDLHLSRAPNARVADITGPSKVFTPPLRPPRV